MAFLPFLSSDELHHYQRVISRSVEVRSHLDVMVWLQGDMQRYLPHDIMVASWGDFSKGAVLHDVISKLDGVRSKASYSINIAPLLQRLFSRWQAYGKRPYALNVGQSGFLTQNASLQCALGSALQTMRSAVVHGISDERGSHDCLYVAFSTQDAYTDEVRGAMAMVLPYLDTALRQVAHLPHQAPTSTDSLLPTEPGNAPGVDLTDREAEILKWVALGKTNPEIGSILNISSFTVKNHVQRVFKKLDVTNRAQAVGKFHKVGQNV